MQYLAHVNDSGDQQSLREHSIQVAEKCFDFSVGALKPMAYLIGLLHDLGKYQAGFQKRIGGADIKVEHSVCGAQVLRDRLSDCAMIINLMMQVCIIGHHTGLPDFGTRADNEHDASFQARLKRSYEDIRAWENELSAEFESGASKLNPKDAVQFLINDIDANQEQPIERFIDKMSFFTRYLYSCLVDADSLDTKAFCEADESGPSLKADFVACLDKVNQKMKGFVATTELQKKRSEIQKQVFDSVHKKADIYFMDMPTGSGKTLASLKFALEKIVSSMKSDKPLKRLIYVIPFNGIIDQTASVFEELFQEDAPILRHQSSYHYESKARNEEDFDYTKRFIGAKENWDAPIIITTAVQFFESLHKHRRKHLRKIHNIENSILVFDEVHTLPLKYMQPCLQSIAYLVKS